MNNKDFNPKILALLCNWCSYAGADLAGISRLQYPANIRIIRLPCSGRVNPLYILKGLEEGADAVWISGCHPGDCHYGSGNYYARRRLSLFKEMLEFVGFEGERVKLSWISASEGPRFQQAAKEVTESVKSVGENKKFRKKSMEEVLEDGV